MIKQLREKTYYISVMLDAANLLPSLSLFFFPPNSRTVYIPFLRVNTFAYPEVFTCIDQLNLSEQFPL